MSIVEMLESREKYIEENKNHYSFFFLSYKPLLWDMIEKLTGTHGKERHSITQRQPL